MQLCSQEVMPVQHINACLLLLSPSLPPYTQSISLQLSYYPSFFHPGSSKGTLGSWSRSPFSHFTGQGDDADVMGVFSRLSQQILNIRPGLEKPFASPTVRIFWSWSPLCHIVSPGVVRYIEE
jgi:hypothetical protein